MAEAEQSDKNTSTPHRRQYYQNRPGLPYRGRGRANASVSKALYLFGVRDLREILDRKHQDDEQSGSGPPPDPSYNYLKDPSRENAEEYQTQRYHKGQPSERAHGDSHPRKYSFRGHRGRGRGGPSHRDNRHHELETPSFIENPVNIKVEVVTSTGQRNYSLDEETKIADIKRIPNYKLKDLRPKKSGQDETEQPRDFPDKFRNERGRGRGQRGRRGRGWGERGRGRGRGRYPNRNNEPSNESQQPTTDEIAEKDLSKDCADAPAKNEEGHENEGGHEEDYAEGLEHEDDPEQYYESEENEYAGVKEQNETLEEATGPDEIKLDENLVVTSSENEDKCKRSVKFKLNDKQIDEAEKEEVKNEKETVEIESSRKEENKKLEPTTSGE